MDEAIKIAIREELSELVRPSAECLNVFNGHFHEIALTLKDIGNTLKNIELSVGEIRDRQNEFDKRMEVMESAVEDLIRWKKNQWKILASIWGVIVAIGGYIITKVIDALCGKIGGA